MKNYVLILLFIVFALEWSNTEAQRLRSHRVNRQRLNQQSQGQRSQALKNNRFNVKGNKPRQGKQGGSLGRMTCDFAAHYVSDNADFFIEYESNGLFGEDWTFDNGCENHELGCCAEDEDCKCFGIIEELDEELEEPPRCYPLRRNMPAPQFCMKKPQRGRRNRN